MAAPNHSVYSFNPHGALASLTVENQPVLTRNYDRLGRPATARRIGLGVRSFTYDAFSRIVGESQQTDASTTAATIYTLDGNDRLTLLLDASGHTTRFEYDGLDLEQPARQQSAAAGRRPHRWWPPSRTASASWRPQ